MRNPFRKLKRFKPQLPDRQTVRVSTKSWHGRLYNFWKQHAKYKTGSYKENLCHYVRVILIWAPIAAFLHAHPKRWPLVRPATVLFVAAVASGGGYAVYNYPTDVGKVLLIVALVAIAIALLIGALYVIDEYHKEVGAWVGKSRGGRFFKWLARGFGRGVDAVFEFFAQPLSTRHSSFERGWLLLIIPGIVAIVASAILAPWKLLIVVGGVIAFAVIVFVLVFVGSLIAGWIREQSRKNAFKSKKVKHGDGLGTVLGQYVVARKGQICPFIEIES